MKKNIITIIILIISVILFFFFFQKELLGQFIDRIGLSKDSYNINIDEEIRKDLSIYWYGETVFNKKDNKILIYYQSQQSYIPNSYGANTIEINYKDISYDKIGIWKKIPYAKYNYNIRVKKLNGDLIIDWDINNWYDSTIYEGRDTITIPSDCYSFSH